MCRIAGFFDLNADFLSEENLYQNIIQQMNQVQTHTNMNKDSNTIKGNIESNAQNGVMLTAHCGLLLSEPTQNSISISCDGEIYNHQELKKELATLGHTFHTTSDTEVILECYLEYGPAFVQKLDGVFAIAVYDSRHEILYLFRDSFGSKPLFYSVLNGITIFASELKGLFCFPGITPSVSADGLNELFGLGPARSPGHAVFDNIKEVKPGHYLTCNRFGAEDITYFRLQSRPHTDSYEETIAKTSKLLYAAIKRQMQSDTEPCTFLSGGIDSSIVSSVLATELEKEGKTLHTFSFEFLQNDEYFKPTDFQPSLDRPYVDSMVNYLDSNHHYLTCDSLTQADLLESSVKAHDLPCMADIDSSLLYFCKEVSKTHKVVLTGECADEIFGGYPWFHKEELLASNTFPWTPDLTPRTKLLSKEVLSELDMETYVQNAYYSAVREIDILPLETELETKRRRIAYLNIRYFMQTLLNRMERTSMQADLSARVPFADKALLTYVFNVPWEMKAKDGLVKNLLRRSCTGLLPDEVLFRRKCPYPKTYNPAYENLLKERLMDVLSSQSPLLSLIDKKAVLAFLDLEKDYGSPWYGQLMAGPQMIAYLLQIHYWLTDYQIEIRL